MLTGKEIVEKQVITNYEEGNVQQQGIDVRVNRVFGLGKNYDGNWHPNFDLEHIGWIPKEGKTKLLREQEIVPSVYDCGFGWLLYPGYYEIVFWEGKTAEEIYNEYKGEKKIVNGVYCKVIFNTYEAINAMPPIVEYDEGELVDD